MSGWEVGVVGALIFAWVGVLGLVALDLSATARKVLFTALAAIVFGIPQLGCVREKIVYRDSPTAPVVEATPPPAAPSLRFPQGVPDNDIVIVPGIPDPAVVAAVNEEIRAMFPSCSEGQERCDGLGYSPQSFFAVLNGRLRARGLWAGQHRDGETDEITVAKDCQERWNNFHAWAYDGFPIWARSVSEPCAGHACTGKGTSYRGDTIIPASFCK